MLLSARLKTQLSEFYYEVLGGGKLDKTWKRVQREFPGEYTRKQVKEFVDSQASVQFKFTSIHAKEPGGIFLV